MTMRNETVTIAGAGLVGSLLALMLARQGYRVQVFERRPDMRSIAISAGRSINLALSTRGWKALAAAGIDDAIRAEAIPMKGRMIHSTAGELTFQPYGRENQAIYSVSRGGLNMTLMDQAEALPNVSFHFRHRCLDADLETAAATFLNEGSGKTHQVRADYLIGADGAFSAVRGRMQFMDRFDYSQSYLAHGYKELLIPAAPDGGWLIDKNALHIWPRGQFMLIALPNPDGSFTCTLFFPFEGDPSFASIDSSESLQRFFRQTFPDALALMPSLNDDYFRNPTSSLVTVRCSPWVANDKVALIGDAAHAIVPFYGQGMNAGFEDCSVLLDCLAEHEHRWADALEAYQGLRIDNANAIADLALRNFVEMRDLVADPHFLLRKKIEKKINLLYPNTFLPVYSIVSFSHLPYGQALQESRLQDKFLVELMNIPDIEQAVDSPAFEERIRTMIKEYEPAAASA